MHAEVQIMRETKTLETVYRTAGPEPGLSPTGTECRSLKVIKTNKSFCTNSLLIANGSSFDVLSYIYQLSDFASLIMTSF